MKLKTSQVRDWSEKQNTFLSVKPYNNVVNYHSVMFKHCSVVCSRVSLLHVEPLLHPNNTTLLCVALRILVLSVLDR